MAGLVPRWSLRTLRWLLMAANSDDVRRYRANLQGEVDGAALYGALADAESDPKLASVYRRLSSIESL